MVVTFLLITGIVSYETVGFTVLYDCAEHFTAHAINSITINSNKINTLARVFSYF